MQHEYFKDERNTASETNNRPRDELDPRRSVWWTPLNGAGFARAGDGGDERAHREGRRAQASSRSGRRSRHSGGERPMIEDEADAIMCPNEAVLEDYKARQRQVETIEAGLVDQGDRSKGPRRRSTPSRVDALAASAGGDHGRELANFRRQGGEAGSARTLAATGWICVRDLGQVPRGDGHAHPDAHRQSGGERSVSTMLYLISLQELTRARSAWLTRSTKHGPVNERKIFARGRGVEGLHAADVPATPKLLNNLQYTEDCTVLCIFNVPRSPEARNGVRCRSAAAGAAAGHAAVKEERSFSSDAERRGDTWTRSLHFRRVCVCVVSFVVLRLLRLERTNKRTNERRRRRRRRRRRLPREKRRKTRACSRTIRAFLGALFTSPPPPRAPPRARGARRRRAAPPTKTPAPSRRRFRYRRSTRRYRNQRHEHHEGSAVGDDSAVPPRRHLRRRRRHGVRQNRGRGAEGDPKFRA